jgi:hypothetical protein
MSSILASMVGDVVTAELKKVKTKSQGLNEVFRQALSVLYWQAHMDVREECPDPDISDLCEAWNQGKWKSESEFQSAVIARMDDVEDVFTQDNIGWLTTRTENKLRYYLEHLDVLIQDYAEVQAFLTNLSEG